VIDNPVVTVITPAYNVRDYIAQSIASVAAQTEKRFEYIVVDDGSSDDTVQQIEQAFAGDARMRLIRADHRGGAAARNTAIAQARAPFISFLDGDDLWHPEKLAHQLAVMERLPHEYGVVFSRSRLVTESNLVVGLMTARPGRYDVDDLLVHNCPPRNGSSLLFRASCFDEAGMFDEAYTSACDYEVELRIACESKTPLFWADRRYLVDYRLRQGQVSRSVGDRLASVDKILQQYVPNMRRLPASRVYIDHAVVAHRTDQQEYIAAWSDLARSSGVRVLIRSLSGWRLLAWRALGPRGSAVYRTVNHRSLDVARTVLRQVGRFRPHGTAAV
jgi:glycosyltransferase involved in cell wall biosynthesis